MPYGKAELSNILLIIQRALHAAGDSLRMETIE